MFIKLFNMLKMTWMFSWRLIAMNFLFSHGQNNRWLILTAFVISAVLVFGLNKHILTFPIVRLLKRTSPIKAADGSDEQPTVRVQEKPQTNEFVPPEVTGDADRGRITGFEPKILASLPVPRNRNMEGIPGEGLDEATHFDENSIQLGKLGEENFAKALQMTGLLERFKTLWSVPVLDFEKFKAGPYNTDIDCILATKNTVYLIDLKHYMSGNIIWTSSKHDELVGTDGQTGKLIEVKEMSRNMEMATKAARRHFNDVKIVPVVVFMPTDKGEAFVQNVYWPGHIRGVNLAQFLAELSFEEVDETGRPNAVLYRWNTIRRQAREKAAKKAGKPFIDGYEYPKMKTDEEFFAEWKDQE